MPPVPERVEKVMALSPAEFRATLAPLAGGPLAGDALSITIPLAEGSVTVGYEPRAGVLLGGLLELPRACVSLVFTGVPPAGRAAFLVRFERSFQRGGG